MRGTLKTRGSCFFTSLRERIEGSDSHLNSHTAYPVRWFMPNATFKQCFGSGALKHDARALVEI